MRVLGRWVTGRDIVIMVVFILVLTPIILSEICFFIGECKVNIPILSPMLNETCSCGTKELNTPEFLLQFAQAFIIAAQLAILIGQLEAMLKRHHKIPLIVLRYSNGIINVKNLTDNPAFHIKLEEIRDKKGKKIDGEFEIAEYLGPGEEKKIRISKDSAKDTDTIKNIKDCKISYWDIYEDRHEIVCKVNEEDGQLTFTCMPPRVFKQKRKDEKRR